jgi:hypothetical protein
MAGRHSWVLQLAVALALVAVIRNVQPREPSLEELEMERLLEQASASFEKQGLSIEEMSADFQYRCLRSIGDTPFCECLVRKRPYPLRFEQYVGITSRTRAELDYEGLSDTSRNIVDEVFLLRDACVAR